MTALSYVNVGDPSTPYTLEVEGLLTVTPATKAQALEAAGRGVAVALWSGSCCVFRAGPLPGYRAADPWAVWADLFAAAEPGPEGL